MRFGLRTCLRCFCGTGFAVGGRSRCDRKLLRQELLDLLSLGGRDYALPAGNSSVFVVFGHAITEIVADDYQPVHSSAVKAEMLLRRMLSFGYHYLW